MMMSEKESKELKKQTKIDVDFLNQLLTSFKDIKEGRVRRVK